MQICLWIALSGWSLKRETITVISIRGLCWMFYLHPSAKEGKKKGKNRLNALISALFSFFSKWSINKRGKKPKKTLKFWLNIMHFSDDCAALTVSHQLAVVAGLRLPLFHARAALVFLGVVLRTFFILVESRLGRLNITASADSLHLPLVEAAVFLRSVCQVAAAATVTAAGPGGEERDAICSFDGFSSGADLFNYTQSWSGPARPGPGPGPGPVCVDGLR